MTPVVIQHEQKAVRIPAWVSDLASFRRWAKSDDFPEHGWYAHLNGEIWVDPSMEKLAHNKIKTEVARVLATLAKDAGNGQFLSDRMLLTNRSAELSSEPDGMFVTYEAIRSGRCRLEQGDDSLEVEGSPELVLEVVSPSSRQKDTVVLRDLYWRAGVDEYWLVNATARALSFDVLRHGARGYTAARKQDGWVKSGLFGRSFRLTRQSDPLGEYVYLLTVR